jgi:hypothetical protein
MTRLPMIAQRIRHGLPLFGARAAIVLGVALAMAPTSVLADVHVAGSPEAVSIDAQNTSIKEILAALGNAFDVHYQSSANLDKQLTGTYEGSLRWVVTRLLEGYNFIIRTNQGRIEVTVLGTQNGPQTVEAPAKNVALNAPVSPGATAQTPAQAAQSHQPTSSSISRAAPPPPAISSTSSRVAEQLLPGSADDASSSALGPTPPFKVAEGPSPPTPVLSESSAAGPVPRPATGSMPQPTPTPGATGANGPELPMPTANSAFPGITTTTNPSPAAPAEPTTQKP